MYSSFSSPKIVSRGSGVDVIHGDDTGLYVEFFHDVQQDEEASNEKGRPIFFDVVKVKIKPLGDKTTEIIRIAKDKDKARFSRQWEIFQRKGDQEIGEGTPLHEWPPLLKSQVMNLKGMDIHTVEKLAEVPDAALKNIPQGLALRKKAKAYLESADNDKGATKWAKEKTDLENKIDTLQKQVDDIGRIKSNKGKKDGDIS